MIEMGDNGTLIITAASRGIGAAIAERAAARGFAVAVNFASSAAAAGEVVRRIVSAGGRAVAIHADVASEKDILRLFETAATTGSILAIGGGRG